MTEERGHVLVLGSINADLVVRVTHLPAPGETVTGGVFDRHQGGKGANQAVAAARLGARVTMVGSVGDDELGGLARDSLRGEGVDVEAVRRSHGPTGVALIVVDDAGENQIAVASGANSDVGPEALRDVDLVRGGVFLSNFEIPDEAVVPGRNRRRGSWHAGRHQPGAGTRHLRRPAAHRADPCPERGRGADADWRA